MVNDWGILGVSVLLAAMGLPIIGEDIGWWTYTPQYGGGDFIRYFGGALGWFLIGFSYKYPAYGKKSDK